ncbi:hypothetical protein KY290_000682 [Solanum tuberosum]|uniref:RNA-directed DNA polymerase (Reverse transcriptase) n=1 Tax=Solanum tuberosum TaxID=4113 RepID=A0ABQ7WK08_SOLTU|nr:hypothetical protein KY289_000745 [Solanum tuberosum]KAH0781084.1 hypothetical protein KY290_000682 [Solanum tuberosum]
MRSLEDNSVNHNMQENREILNRARVEFTKCIELQDKITRQKARVKWLQEGDANTAFFHSIIKDRRKNITIKNIKDMDGNWIEGDTAVANTAVKYFEDLSSEEVIEDDNVLNVVKKVITEEDNAYITAPPTMQEVRDSVFSIDPDSSPGPDGLNGKFFQSTWHIIAYDLFKAISFFIKGAPLPKFSSLTLV